MLFRRDKNEKTHDLRDPVKTTDLRAIQKHLQVVVSLGLLNTMACDVERNKTKLLCGILSQNCLEDSIQDSLVYKQFFRSRNPRLNGVQVSLPNNQVGLRVN